MRPLLLLTVLTVLAACSPRTHAPPLSNRASASTRPAQGAPRCLPVVAFDCGCVYGCGLGQPNADGSYAVTYGPMWKDPVRAVVKPWCVDGKCTDAFAGEIVCDGICLPKPADATCHLDGSSCTSNAR
jgi:hypothetical protein